MSFNYVVNYIGQPHCGLGIDSTSNRNEFQEYFLGGKVGRCLGLTTYPPSIPDCLGASTSWEPSGPVRPVKRFALPGFT